MHAPPAGIAYGIDSHFRFHVALVDQSLLQLPARAFCQLGAINHRRLPHPAQPLVVPFGGILSRQAVGPERKLGEPEHLMVGMLAEEIGQLGAVDILVVAIDCNAYLIQKILSLGHVLHRRASRRKQEHGKKRNRGDNLGHGLHKHSHQSAKGRAECRATFRPAGSC